MAKTIVQFPEKETGEIVPYTFNFAGYDVFKGSSPESIVSVSFIVYLATDDPLSPTAIPAMIYAVAYSGTKATCWVGHTPPAVDSEGEYILRVRATTNYGSIFEEQGRFTVAET